ncbi:MAG: cation:proton antiporter [Burkholderiaceae bacterium]|nr:cation:proton antiporter [Burkholderiaceae bacterium]
MSSLTLPAGELVWAVAAALAWVIGEVAARLTPLPRISAYALVGFALSYAQLGWLPRPSESSMMVLANIGLGLILFECGYRTNLRWFVVNPWLGATSAVQAVLSFAVVHGLVTYFGGSPITAALLAALALVASPPEVLRIINEQRSSGQVTERLLHLSVLSAGIAVLLFNGVVGFWAFRNTGSAWQAVYGSALTFAASVAIGTGLGMALPLLLRWLGTTRTLATAATALAVVLLVVLAHQFKLSSVLAALTFGLVVRQRRIVLSPAQRDFGPLGELLLVLLFVFLGASLSWARVLDGFWLAWLIVGVRLVSHGLASLLFARASGISWRKGALAGLGLAPLSALVLALLVETRYLGINLMDQLSALAGATLIMAVAGPMLTRLALQWAHELPGHADRH